MKKIDFLFLCDSYTFFLHGSTLHTPKASLLPLGRSASAPFTPHNIGIHTIFSSAQPPLRALLRAPRQPPFRGTGGAQALPTAPPPPRQPGAPPPWPWPRPQTTMAAAAAAQPPEAAMGPPRRCGAGAPPRAALAGALRRRCSRSRSSSAAPASARQARRSAEAPASLKGRGLTCRAAAGGVEGGRGERPGEGARVEGARVRRAARAVRGGYLHRSLWEEGSRRCACGAPA